MTRSYLDNICLNLKGTTTDIKWGNDLCYCVGGKMYCTTSVEGTRFVSFKVMPENFKEVTEREGIIPAPYSARYHWVMVEDLKALTLKEWDRYIRGSYTLVFQSLSKKLQMKLNA